MNRRTTNALLLVPPLVWLLVMLFVPLVIVCGMSLTDAAFQLPPYTPLLENGTWMGDLENYTTLWQDDLYRQSLYTALKLAFGGTFLCLLIAYPMAYGMARATPRMKPVLLLLVLLPFWTSLLIRAYAWIELLRENGLINTVLLKLGLIEAPLTLLYTHGAVMVGIAYAYLPFMVLPIYVTLEKLDPRLIEAAANLGAKPATTLWRVVWPLSLPGVVAGCLLVFIPALGEVVIPDLLGGSEILPLGKALWQEFFSKRDWPMAAALTIALTLCVVLPTLLLNKVLERKA